MHTLDDMIKFILENRYKNKMTKAFPESRPIDIMYALVSAMKMGTYSYAENINTGKLCGVVYGELEENNVWYLHNIIATEKWVIPHFVKIFLTKWPDYTIKIYRKGRFRFLTLTQLNRLLNKI